MKISSDLAAVVTGGASGLGRATAEALAAAGIKVSILDLDEENGEAIAAEIAGRFCKADITSEDSMIAGFETARAAHGQERILVHCAMAIQAIVHQRSRATATAIFLFILNTFGLGMGAICIGALSDVLSARLGPAEGLRWAMVALTSVCLLSGYCFWRARTRLEADLVAT